MFCVIFCIVLLLLFFVFAICLVGVMKVLLGLIKNHKESIEKMYSLVEERKKELESLKDILEKQNINIRGFEHK